MPSTSSRHAVARPSCQGTGRGTKANRKRETGHYDSPSRLGYDPPARIESVKEGRLAGSGPLPDRPSPLQQSAEPVETAQGGGKEGLCIRTGTSGQASSRV